MSARNGCGESERRRMRDFANQGGISEEALRELFRKEIAIAGGTRKLAKLWKVSAAFISDISLGRRRPGPKILKRMGYERVSLTITNYKYTKCAP
jgi:hypothetical protein